MTNIIKYYKIVKDKLPNVEFDQVIDCGKEYAFTFAEQLLRPIVLIDKVTEKMRPFNPLYADEKTINAVKNGHRTSLKGIIEFERNY